jgi:two-component system sensor histidine kinase YesM
MFKLIIKEKIKKIFLKIIKEIKYLRLSNKLILAYILIIAVPVCIFSVIIFKRFENSVRNEALNKNKYELQLEVSNINRNMDAFDRTVQMILNDKKLMDYVRTSKEPMVEELVEFNQETYRSMMQTQYNNALISEINIFTDNPNVYEIWPLIFNESRVNNKDWYNSVIINRGKVKWEINKVNDEMYDKNWGSSRSWAKVVSLCRTIESSNSSHVGVIRVSMLSKDFFSKMYNDVKDTDGQVFVIDNDYIITTNENSSFTSEKGIDKQFIKQEFLKNKDHKGDNFELTYNKENMVVTYTKLERLDAFMINVSSIDSLVKYTNKIRNLFIVGTLILISILSVVTYFITYLILKRLYIIIHSMKKIQAGDFNVDISVRSNDEVGELAHHFRKMLKKINELISEAVEKRSATKEAELRALQTQIDSHFIYNTLENIKMMAEIEEQFLISDSLTSLGAMMRYNMKWNSEYASLGDEINHIKNYIALMNIRFDSKINLEIEVEEKLLTHEVLKMSLQPLVENAVKHGLVPVIEHRDGNLKVLVKAEDKTLRISVIDNGVGISEEEIILLKNRLFSPKSQEKGDINSLQTKSSGIALINVNERLKLFYGEEYGIDIYSQANVKTVISIIIPY